MTAYFYRDACLTAGELLAAAVPGIPCPVEVAWRAAHSAASMRLLRELMSAPAAPSRQDDDRS